MRLLHGRRGGNAIEFALTLPLFMMLMVGLMDYGYLFAMQAGLDNAVSLSCRDGALIDPGLFPGQVEVEAHKQLGIRGAPFCGGVCTPTNGLADVLDAVPNQTLRCELKRPLVPLIGFLPSSMYPATIHSVSFYRLEWQRK
jgi:hypothetical protein